MNPATGRTRSPKQVLAAACGAHALHDGLIDGILVFLPIFQAHFALSFGVVGMLRATATGTMALAQVPAGAIAGRIGGRLALAVGTAIASLGYLAAGLSGGFASVLLGFALIGLGASVQHPVASEFVAAAYGGTQRRMSLGIYNFSGDVGKTLIPPTAALLVVLLDWRIVCGLIFALAFVASLVLFLALPHDARDDAAAKPVEQAAPIVAGPGPFRLLIAIGIFDSATRMAFLTFMPFLLAAKGGTIETTGLALSLVFAGGACGKFVCAWLGTRLGPIATVVLTEVMTAIAIAGVALSSLGVALALLPILGVALNGTSSILYGSVADLVPEHARRRAFAMFYAATIGSGAVAPVIAGLFIDRVGLPVMLAVAAALALVVVPLALALRPAFHAPLSGANTSPSR